METITELKTVACWCGAPMALPATLIENAKKTGATLYCPATGHGFSWKSENEKLRRQLERERLNNIAAQDQLRAAEARTSSLKGQLTKERKRTRAGMCPCCKRSFVQLARHMSTKHPNFDPKAG